MNDTTFQGDGKITYVPVVVNAKPPKQTNYDRIVSKTPEELAEWIAHPKICYCQHDICDGETDCAVCALQWLKQEASDGKD